MKAFSIKPKVVERVRYQDADGQLLGEFAVVQLTLGGRLRVLRESKRAGETNDKDEPVDSMAALLVHARMVVEQFRDPDTLEQIYNQSQSERILEEPWFELYVDEIGQKALAAQEAAKSSPPKPQGPKSKSKTKPVA